MSKIKERKKETLRDFITEKEVLNIGSEMNRQMVGKTLPVLVEGLSPETDLLLRGRTASMAPDVDGQVLINKGQGVVGTIQPAFISEAHTYDLIGEIV